MLQRGRRREKEAFGVKWLSFSLSKLLAQGWNKVAKISSFHHHQTREVLAAFPKCRRLQSLFCCRGLKPCVMPSSESAPPLSGYPKSLCQFRAPAACSGGEKQNVSTAGWALGGCMGAAALRRGCCSRAPSIPAFPGQEGWKNALCVCVCVCRVVHRCVWMSAWV